MSTDFLNRRMDLKHTHESRPGFIDQFGNTVGGSVNLLIMDTSYPVKLAGKVVKIFTASSDFNTDKWILENSDKDVILTVENDSVYDFAGRVIKDSIGEGKAYPSITSVFKNNDYVMTIIDFDNKKIFLCSQTNFSVFITGDNIGDDCKFKLFDITGESEMPGYEYNINEEVFDLAVEFEKEEGNHSFVRHNEDNVVYEVPTNKDGKRNMIPISNVDSFNINSINTAVQNLIFPFINPGSGGGGIDGIDAFHAYRTINGSVNDKFVNEYCYTYEEVNALNWSDYGYSKEEINGLSNPNDYYYALATNSYTDSKTTNEMDDGFRFLPIKKDTLSFASFSDINVGGITCNENAIISMNPYTGNNLVGNWWNDDISKGYGVTFHQDISSACRIGILKPTILDDEGKLDKSNTDYTEGTRTRLYSDWSSGNEDVFISRFGINETETYKSEEMKFLKRFLDFFAFNGNYNKILKHISMTLFNSTVNDSLRVYGSDTNRTPFCVTAIYPEIFENVLFDTNADGQFTHSNENLSNFTSFYNSSETGEFNRINYKSSKYDCRDTNGDKYLVYALFEKGISKGSMKRSDNSNPTQTIYGLSSQEQKLKFISNRNILGDSFSNYIVERNQNDSSNYDYIMLNLMSKLNVAKINDTFSESDTKLDYNTAHIGHENFVVMRGIILPKLKTMCEQGLKHKNFFYDSENDKYFVNYKAKEYEVYTIVYNNNTLEFVKLNKEIFKNTSKFNGLSDYMYLYFINTSCSSEKKYATIYQMKYYYDKDRDSSQSDEVYTSSKINESFDFFSVAKLLYTGISSEVNWEKHNRFETGYLNKLVEKGICSTIEEAINNLKTKFDFSKDTTESDMINSIKDVIIDVVKDYHLFPYFSKDEDDIIITDSVLGRTSAIDMTVSHDYSENYHEGIFFASWVNNINLNNGKGFRLRDMIGYEYSIYQNCMVPYVSNTEIDGSLVYTMETYNKYLKDTLVSNIYFTGEFPFINGTGIRKEYYEGKSLYEFYNYILTRDLSIPMSNPKSLINKIGGNTKKVFYSKKTLSNVANVVVDRVSGKRLFMNSSSINISITNTISLNENINPNSVYGFNPGLINDVNSKDVTDEYITDEFIFVNKEQSGVKTTYSLSLADGNTKVPSLLPLNGTLGEISTDKLNWLQLLLSLNNNKSIDILGNLSNIKNELNRFFLLASQNISDIYPIEESINDNDANSHDNIFSEDSKYYKDHNADFDTVHNIYNFFYGYGYKNQVRELNNRGVIVFVTEGARTLQNRTGNVGEVPEDYTYDVTQGKVYPKRMYISKDGLLCTKEYYDKELNETNDYQSQIDELQRQIDALKIKIGDVYANLMQSVWKFNDVVNLSVDMKDGDTTNEQVTALREKNSTLRDTKYDDISSIANAIYSYNDTVYNYINSIKTSTEYLNTLQTCNNRINSSVSNDSLITNIKAYNTELINYLFDIEWISDKETVQYYNNIISI